MKIVRILWLTTGLCGLIIGSLMLLRPDGSALSLELQRLAQSPVSNYALPGLFVGIFYGAIPLALVALFKENRTLWSLVGLGYLGLSLAWIATEHALWGIFDWPHLVFVLLNGSSLVLLLRQSYIAWRDTQK